LSVDSQIGKVGNIDTLLSLSYWNRLSSISGLNLKLDVPSYKFLRNLSVLFSNALFLINSISVSGVLRELINLPVTRGVYGLLSSSFKDKKFNPSVFSGILKVF